MIERHSHLLPALDQADAEQQQRQLAAQGLQVLTDNGIERILGDTCVAAIQLTDGRVLECDLLVLATGIRPHIALAQTAGLPTRRGICVDDRLQTADPYIFAIGDCAEHAGKVYGLLAPGLEQAEALAQILSGEQVHYSGSHPTPRLKWPVQQPKEPFTGIANWPAERTVCECNQVTRGQLSAAILQGCTTLSSLCQHTGAASNCGSCRPLLTELLGTTAQPVNASPLLQTAAFISIFAGLLYLLLPGLGYQDSVTGWQWDGLWRNTLSRQITGFSLLSIALTVSFISIRKRWQGFRWGEFSSWRNTHVLLGLLTLVTLLIHTGARLGENLNLALMLCFIGVLLSGGLLSASIAHEHRWQAQRARQLRLGSLWLHLLLLWPLPALLAFHILKTYYF